MPPATQMVHWPGQDTPACDLHAAKLVNVGAAMGFRVSVTPCEETVFTNCENEEKKNARKSFAA